MMDDNSSLDIVERGLRGNAIDNLVEGWSFMINETSSNVYKVDGIDKYGHKISRQGIDPNKVLVECVKTAQRISQRTNFIAETKANVAKILKLRK
jgi:hypothetical protein